MLKVKRIAKVLLCICVAFSMLITVFADIEEIQYRNIALNKFVIPNNHISIDDYNLIISKGYNILNYSYNVTETSDNEPIININTNNNKKFIIIIKALYSDYKNPNNISGNTVSIDQFRSTSTGFIPYYYTVLECTPNNNNVQFTLTYVSGGETKEASISSFILVDNESKTQKLLNSINNTINGIINIGNSIINFLNDKPWIILLGVSISLISFLIYKAKTII